MPLTYSQIKARKESDPEFLIFRCECDGMRAFRSSTL